MIETEACLLPNNQHDSEASFFSQHPSLSFGGICQRNGFDHGTDLLQGQGSVSSASIEDPVIVPAIERIPNRVPLLDATGRESPESHRRQRRIPAPTRAGCQRSAPADWAA